MGQGGEEGERGECGHDLRTSPAGCERPHFTGRFLFCRRDAVIASLLIALRSCCAADPFTAAPAPHALLSPLSLAAAAALPPSFLLHRVFIAAIPVPVDGVQMVQMHLLTELRL